MGIAINEEKRKKNNVMQTDTPPLFYKIKINENLIERDVINENELLEGSNLKEGVNLISFTGRDATADNLCTFHHAVLYISTSNNICYIIDSWSAINKDTKQFECRVPTYRQKILKDVLKCLYELNTTESIPVTVKNMNIFFLAHDTLPHALVLVNATKPEYIVEIANKAKDQLEKGMPTNFGGRRRKRKSTKKNKSKKNKSKRNKSKKNKRNKKRI